MAGMTTRMKSLLLALGVSTFLSSPLAASSAQTATDDAQYKSRSLAGNYLAARIAAIDKDTQSAAVFYRATMALDPDNVELKQRAFLTFISNGDFAEGVEIGRDLKQAGLAPEIAHLILSVDHLRAKAWASAERELDQEWRSALDRLVAGLMLGWVEAGQGKFTEALARLDDLRGPPWFDLFVQYHGGLIALMAGKQEDAIERLQNAFNNKAGGQAYNETYTRVVQALTYAHVKANNTSSALEQLEEGLRLQPQNPIFGRMMTNIRTGKKTAATVSSAQRGVAEVYLNLGAALNKEGGEQFARIYMQLAQALAPDDDLVVVSLADLLDRQRLIKRSNDLFGKIDADSPYYRIARLEIALNLDELGNMDAAKKEMDALLESGPDDLVTHLSYGAVLARHEQFHEAAAIYNKILVRIKDPQRFHWNLVYRLGIAYERTKQWPKAEAAFKQALELYPNQPSVLNYLGYSWVDMDINLEEGLAMIQKAVELRPNDGYMVDSLGWAYYRLGQFDNAVRELERAVNLRPGDPTINDHLGDAYWRAGRKLEGMFQWKHALALDPPKADISKIQAKIDDGLDAASTDKAESPEEKAPDNG